MIYCNTTSGTCPTKNISIEFEILPKFAMLWYKMYSTDHNEILNYSTPNFDRISNSIEIPIVGRAPGHNSASTVFSVQFINEMHCL